jgi:hypothetical protein
MKDSIKQEDFILIVENVRGSGHATMSHGVASEHEETAVVSQLSAVGCCNSL